MSGTIAKIFWILTALACVHCGLPEGDYFGDVPSDPDPTHLRWCNSGEPEYLDSAMVTSTTGTSLSRLLFAGLAEFGLDSAGTPVPSVALRWDVSNDLRTFRFHLRKDARWSNGRKLTSDDFLYHTARILHPTTLSRNQGALDYIKGAQLYAKGRLLTLTEASPPFKKGEVVELVGVDGVVAEDLDSAELPNPSLRKSSKRLHLRDYSAEESAAYAEVGAGEEVEIIEIRQGWKPWAYVFHMGEQWRYGWVPLTDLDLNPSAAQRVTVRELPPEQRVGVSLPNSPGAILRQGAVPGEHLLRLPTALGVQAPDPYTLVVETVGPTPFLIEEAATRMFRPGPRESISRDPLQWVRPNKGLIVTSGAFNLVGWDPRDKLSFVKSKTFFEKDLVKIQRLTAYSIDDQAASTNIYFQGGCDATTANNIPYSYLPALSGAKRGKPYKDFHMAPYDGIYYFAINTEKLQNVHLRRALTMSINREPLPDILHGGEIPSSQYVPGRAISSLSAAELALCKVTKETPGVARIVAKDQHCYTPPQGLGFNPEEARKELALAKEELGDEFPTSLDFKYNTGSEAHKIVAEFAQEEWKNNLGLDVKLSTMEWKTYLKETASGNYYIARLGWIGGPSDPENEFHNIFKCGSSLNRSRWCNKEYDALLQEASTTVDRGRRLEILSRAEKIILEEVPLIPLFVYTQKLLKRPYVRDLPLNMGSRPPLHRAWIDPDWKAHQKAKAQPGEVAP